MHRAFQGGKGGGVSYSSIRMGLFDLAILKSLKILIKFKMWRAWVAEPKWEYTEEQMTKILNTDFSFKKNSCDEQKLSTLIKE